MADDPNAPIPPDSQVPDAPTTDGAPSPDPDSGNAILCLIPDPETASKLAVEGGEAPESLHVTLVFLGPTANLDRATLEDVISTTLTAMASVDDTDEDAGSGTTGSDEAGGTGVVDPDEDADADSAVLNGTFNGIARFSPDPDQGTPIVATLDAPGLTPLAASLGMALRVSVDGIPAPTHGLVPHLTLQYLPDIGADDPAELPPPPMVEASFTDVYLAFGDSSDPANLTAFSLTGQSSPTSSVAPAGTVSQMAAGDGVPTPVDAPDDTDEPSESGDQRTMPVAGPLGSWEACILTEGQSTDEMVPLDEMGDEMAKGRLVPPGVLTWREPPLPVGFAMDDMGNPADNGHMGAPVAGAATKVYRDGNHIMASGPYLDNPAGAAMKAAIDGGAPIGPSIDLGASGVWEITQNDDDSVTQVLQEGSIAGFCMLPYEAMHSSPDGEWLTWIRSVPDSAGQDATEPLEGEMPDEVPLVAAGGLREADEPFGAPLYPPAAWLSKPAPQTGEIIGITATDEGQVFGHIAGGTCHISFPGTCLTLEESRFDKTFEVFHKGLDGTGRGIRTAEGTYVPVGQITLSGGHADVRMSASAARKHYDDTDSIIASVHLSWDPVAKAPWAAGAFAHTVTKGQVQVFRAAGEVSVDYRRPDVQMLRELRQLEDGRLHMIGLPVVPRGGLPPVRALIASGELQTVILAAATGSADWPLAERDRTFQDGEVEPRIRKWASTDGSGDLDKMDWPKYRSVHFWWDEDNPELEQSYKMKFCDVIDGRVHAVPRGIFVAAAEMQGARGGVDIPEADREGVRGRIAGYYGRMAKEFNDPSITPPWEDKATTASGTLLLLDLAQDLYVRRFEETAAVLASAHEEEARRLGSLL